MHISPRAPHARLAGHEPLLIATLLGVLIIALLSLTNVIITVLSGTRAYASAEGQYAKGQKDAVFFLLRYATTRDEQYFTQYEQAIAVPLGDQQARLTLEQTEPDLQQAYQGFIQGHNHPDDVATMAWLFRTFRNVQYLDQAIAIWADADRLINRLRERAIQLHAAIDSGANDAQVEIILLDIVALNQQLTRLEDAFAETLGDASRWIQSVVLLATLVVGALLFVSAGTLAWWLTQRIRQSELRYRTLLESASDALVISDAATGQIIEANGSAQVLTGWTLGQLTEMTVTQLHGGGAPDGHDQEGAMWEGACLHRDGRVVPVEVSSTHTTIGGMQVVQHAYRDMTARKQAEVAREEAERRQRAAEDARARLQEELIRSQQATLADLSTPLIPVSDQVLVMPLVGALDSERMQRITATLLDGIAHYNAHTAIIDITGVPVMDTDVAHALTNAAQAVGLLGAQVVLSGMRPEVAQTIVGLGLAFTSLRTCSTLQDGIMMTLSTRLRSRVSI